MEEMVIEWDRIEEIYPWKRKIDFPVISVMKKYCAPEYSFIAFVIRELFPSNVKDCACMF